MGTPCGIWAKGTEVALDGERVAICPACGYPTLVGVLCAVCIPASIAAGIDSAIQKVAGPPGVNPAA